METNNGIEKKYCASFSSIGYDKDTTKVFIDGKEQGNMPLMAELTEGQHSVQIKLLINFRWKVRSFGLDIHHNTLVVVKFNRFFGFLSVMVDGVKKA